jgi:hypothetical protein
MLAQYISLCLLGLFFSVSAAPMVPTVHEDRHSTSTPSPEPHVVTVTETILVTLVQTALTHPHNTCYLLGNLPDAPPSVTRTRIFSLRPPDTHISTRTTNLPAAPPSITSNVRVWPPCTINSVESSHPAGPPYLTLTTRVSETSKAFLSFVFDPLLENSTSGDHSASNHLAPTTPLHSTSTFLTTENTISSHSVSYAAPSESHTSSSATPTPAALATAAAAKNQSNGDEKVPVYPVGWDSTHSFKTTSSTSSPDPPAQTQGTTSTDVLDLVAWGILNNKAKRSEPNNTSRRKTVYWSQFFALAAPAYSGRAQIVRDEDGDQEVSDRLDESKCVTCPKGRDLVYWADALWVL